MSRSLKDGYLTLIQIDDSGKKRRRMHKKKKKGGVGKVLAWASVFAVAVVGVAWFALETGVLEELVRTL